MAKPTLFVGSSGEGLEVARAVACSLRDDAEVTVWNEGVFVAGQGTMEALVNALERFDFAALVLTPDDLVHRRDLAALSARDNVLFELGLFMGRLGRSRTFVVCSDAPVMHLPSDFAGVTVLRFEGGRSDGNLLAAVGASCFQIRQTVRSLGQAEARGLQRLGQATDQVESVTVQMVHLVRLLARSRVLELDVIKKQFGSFLPADFLGKLLDDLRELETATRDAPSGNQPPG